jgi:hypothetical protein
VALDHALVVVAHERDQVFDVVIGLDPPSSGAGAAGEHRMVVDASLREQLSPDRFGEAEVRRLVAVQVADLRRTDFKMRTRRASQGPPRLPATK